MNKTLKKYIFPALLTHSKNEFLEKLTFVKENFDHPFFHLDVMDGRFVSNTCWCSPAKIKTVKLHTPFEVHLMTFHPERRIQAWKKRGASRIHFHIEASTDPLGIIQKIHDADMQAGIALNARTPLKKIELILPHVDAILVMGIDPGDTGRHFQKKVFKKISLLREKKIRKPIIIDGGVTQENAKKLLNFGANYLASTTAIYPKELHKKYAKK